MWIVSREELLHKEQRCSQTGLSSVISPLPFSREVAVMMIFVFCIFIVGEVRKHWFSIHLVRKDAIGHTKGAYRLLKPGKSLTEDSRTAFAWWVVLLQIEEIKIT